jgi:Zn-dependent protease with chaperone function
MGHELAVHVMNHAASGSVFRSLVGYPLFGSAFRTLWPLFLMPMLAAFLGARAARSLPRVPEAWIPAALLAALPGLVAIAELWLVMTASIVGSLSTWRALLLLWFAPGVGLALVGYVMVRAVQRQQEITRLFRISTEPGDRLARAAAALGLRARELATDHKECFVAGVLRPTVFVSCGALSGLSDAELQAALHHERAHVRGRDTLLLFLLSLLKDLVPLARVPALEAYQSAREAAADREAVAHAGRLDLAAALLALARPGPAPAAALPMAKQETLRWRMQAILEDEPVPAAQGSWLWSTLGLVAGAVFLAWPLAQMQLLEVFCWS